MKHILIAFLLLCGICGEAQNRSSWKYQGTVSVGYFIGKTSGGYQVQTIHGIRGKHIFAGLGFGIDSYEMHHLPMFAHAQWHFFPNKNGIFLYGQMGPSVLRARGEWKEKTWTEIDRFDLDNGFMAEGGIGHSIALGRRTGLQFQAGLSHKKVTATEHVLSFPIWSSSILPPGNPSHHDYHYKFLYNRLVLKAGFQF